MWHRNLLSLPHYVQRCVKPWVQRYRQLMQKSEGADGKTKRKMLARENGVFLVIAGRMTFAGLVSVKKQRLACTPVARGR